MQFVLSDALKDYMLQKNKRNIIVEVAQSDGSDFEITELHTHFVSDKQADLFIKRQGFHSYDTEFGKVLLPNYRLDYDDIISFDLRRFLFVNTIKVTGISL